MRILSNLDLRQNQLLNAVIEHLAVAPANPVEGQLYFNTDSKEFKGFANGKWVTLDDAKVLEIVSALEARVATNEGDIVTLKKDVADNAEAISEEITRALAAELVLAGRLDTAEGSIQANANEITRVYNELQSVDSNLSSDISSLNDAIATESQARVDAVEELDGKIATKANSADVYVKTEVDAKVATAETNAIAAARNYTDGKIGEVNSANEELAGKVTALETGAALVDGKIATAKTEAVADAKVYTDGKISEIDTAYKAADAKVLSDAKSYTDSVKTIVDGDVATNLQSAKDYTDAELVKANAITDLKLEGKAEKVHGHVHTEITGLGSLATMDRSEVAVLDEDGKVSLANLPSIAVNNSFYATSIAEAMAHTVEIGDIVVLDLTAPEVKAVVDTFNADQLAVANGGKVTRETRVLNDAYAAALASGITTYIAVAPEATEFEDRFRPLQSSAETISRAEFEQELNKKADKTSVATDIAKAKEEAIAAAKVESDKVQTNLNTAKVELAGSIASVDTKVESVKTDLSGYKTATDAKIAALETADTTLNNRVDGVVSEVNGLKADLGELETQVGTIESTVTSHVENTEVHVTSEERERWNASATKTTKFEGNIVAVENGDVPVVHGLEGFVQVAVYTQDGEQVMVSNVIDRGAKTVTFTFGKVAADMRNLHVVVLG